MNTNVLILRNWIDPGELPDELAISAVSLTELSAGVHMVGVRTADSERSVQQTERARRVDVLQRTENEFAGLGELVDVVAIRRAADA